VPAFQLDKLRVPSRSRPLTDTRWWREWCYVRVVARSVLPRLLVVLGLLLGGGLLFRTLQGDGLLHGMYMTWSLVFGNTPERFPTHPVLQALFFLVPVIGLVVILEAIVDVALLMRDRRRSERSWCMTLARSYSDHIILVGLGRLGYRAFRVLRKLGETVVVIENNPNNQFLDAVRRDGAPLLICDARREAVLHDANIEHAKSIICATTDDMANLEIALDARRVRPDIRVVLRLFDQNMADKVREGFNIHLAMSQAALSAPTFAMAAVDRSILNTIVVGDQLVVMQRWTVAPGGPLAGRTVGDVLRAFQFGIVERRPRHGPHQLYPSADTQLLDGDELIVQGAYNNLVELRRKQIAPQVAGGTPA
jgi:Trk K+ transport system NAD-binding subunit